MRLAVLVILFTVLQGTAAFRVVCVYTNWAQYRPDGGKFLPEDVDPSLCTHIIYVYAKLKGNKLASVEWNDDGNSWSDGMYDRVNNLKQLNPDMKTLLGVGGWNMGSKDFSKMAAGRIYRRIFARSAVKFLRDRNFDGLTIDWQHPTKRGGRPRDRVNFSLLLQEIRKAFDEDSKKTGQPALLLTAGVSASQRIIEDAYEVDNITKYTDFINVFAYDLHGSWENFTGHPSQLYARDEEMGPMAEMNVDATMRYWMSHVPDRTKLNLGISTSGRTFTLADPLMNGVYALAYEPGLAGDFTQEAGMLAYYERCFQYADATRVWDDASKSAYWYSGDQWIAGEDEESVKAKVFWSRRHKIGGVMISSLAMDDFKDKCYGGNFPMLQTIGLAKNDPLPVMPSTMIPLTSEATTTTARPIRRQRKPPVKKINPNLKQAATEIVKKSTDENVIVKENQPSTANEKNAQAVSTKPKPIQKPKPKTNPTVAAPKKGRKGKQPGAANGNKKSPPKKRKGPTRRRLTPEQRRRLFRRKMNNRKEKMPAGWGKRLGINKDAEGNQKASKGKSAGSKSLTPAKQDKPNPNQVQEIVNVDTHTKAAKPTKAADTVNVTKADGDTQSSTKSSNPGNKSKVPNNEKNGKRSKQNKKGRAQILRRQGLGFKRKFKFNKGPGGKKRRPKRPGNKNGAKKPAA